MELSSDVCELCGLLLFSHLYLASVISSHTCPGQLSAEDREKHSIDLLSMRFHAAIASLVQCAVNSTYLGLPSWLALSSQLKEKVRLCLGFLSSL